MVPIPWQGRLRICQTEKFGQKRAYDGEMDVLNVFEGLKGQCTILKSPGNSVSGCGEVWHIEMI